MPPPIPASIRPAPLYLPFTRRQKFLAALVGSILLHVVIVFLVVLYLLVSSWIIRLLHLDHPKPLANLKMVVNVATPTPTPEPVMYPLELQQPTPPPVIDSTGLNHTKKAPDKPLFEADENSTAASEKATTGNVPMPSQDGKDRPELAFVTKKFTMGQGTDSVEEPPVMTFVPAPDVPVTPRPLSTPAPMKPTPAPTPRATPPPTPTPAPTPEKTPPPASPTPTPLEMEEPIFKPTPLPTPKAEPTPDLARPTPVGTPKPAQDMAMLATPKPRNYTESVQPRQPGTSVETQQNKIEGSISNRGSAGVDAIGTPQGRYRKRISDAIGSGWDAYVNQRTDLIKAGSVCIRFYINQSGKVEDLKILSNNSSEALASCSVQAIIGAKLPPPPAELAPMFEDGRYEVTFTFTIYP